MSSFVSPKMGKELRFYQVLKSPWFYTSAIGLAVIIFEADRFIDFAGIAISAFLGTLPYILLAVLLVAYLKATGAETLVGKAFRGNQNRMIVLASLVGGLAPFCSCEIIPFVSGLLQIGTPLPAVMALWLSSPLIDPVSFGITGANLGWQFALYKTLMAVLIGLFGGFSLKFLMGVGAFKDPLKQVSSSSCCSGLKLAKVDRPIWRFWTEELRSQVFKIEAWENFMFLTKWLALAYTIEALMILYIKPEWIQSALGGQGLWPTIKAAAIGIPAYLNSTAAPPLLSSLIENGMSEGAAMAFIIAGAITSIPAMAAVWSLVKTPVYLAYLVLGFAGAVMAGLGYALVI